jgi:hypothetical protein
MYQTTNLTTNHQQNPSVILIQDSTIESLYDLLLYLMIKFRLLKRFQNQKLVIGSAQTKMRYLLIYYN